VAVKLSQPSGRHWLDASLIVSDPRRLKMNELLCNGFYSVHTESSSSMPTT